MGFGAGLPGTGEVWPRCPPLSPLCSLFRDTAPPSTNTAPPLSESFLGLFDFEGEPGIWKPGKSQGPFLVLSSLSSGAAFPFSFTLILCCSGPELHAALNALPHSRAFNVLFSLQGGPFHPPPAPRHPTTSYPSFQGSAQVSPPIPVRCLCIPHTSVHIDFLTLCFFTDLSDLTVQVYTGTLQYSLCVLSTLPDTEKVLVLLGKWINNDETGTKSVRGGERRLPGWDTCSWSRGELVPGPGVSGLSQAGPFCSVLDKASLCVWRSDILCLVSQPCRIQMLQPVSINVNISIGQQLLW